LSKNILVTGAAGFIGSHFCEHVFKNTNWFIYALDGLKYVGDIRRITSIENFSRYKKRISFLYHDLQEPIANSIDEQLENIDYVVNFASHSHVDRSIQEPGPFIKNNISLIINLLDWVRKRQSYSPIEKVVHITTDECYGPASVRRRYKEWDRHIPSNPYAASKSAQEAIVCSYWRTYNIPIILATGMNNFGQRQHVEKLVPKTVRNILLNKVTQIHAEKKKGQWIPGTRSWLHARNFSDAILFLLRNIELQHFPRFDRPCKYNVVGDEQLSNLEVVCKISDIIGVKPNYEFIDFHKTRPGHDRIYSLNGEKLKNCGWHSPYDFNKSFTETINWMVKNKEWLEL
jgi:dTDP-glucose 4,6-dehydratase